eukprot:2390754-Ditylum_brightwellii.AAC.1
MTHTLEQYMESFLNIIDVIKHNDGNIGKHPKLGSYLCKLDGDEGYVNAAVVKLSLKCSTEAYFAYAFISGTNRKKYAKSWRTSPMPTSKAKVVILRH